MLKKIFGIFIIMLFIFSPTTLALTSFNINEQQKKHSIFDLNPCTVPSNGGWMKTLGVIGDNIGYSVQQTTDGGYVIAGGTSQLN